LNFEIFKENKKTAVSAVFLFYKLLAIYFDESWFERFDFFFAHYNS